MEAGTASLLPERSAPVNGRPESNEALVEVPQDDAVQEHMLQEHVAQEDDDLCVECLVLRLQPTLNVDAADRAQAWCDWYRVVGETSVLAFIKTMNNTSEPDADILQDAMMTAYLSVERGAYTPCAGIPFTAYVKGIARNKIREARRRHRPLVPLEETVLGLYESVEQQPHMAMRSVPELVIERQEQHAELWTGIERLPPSRQRVLVGYLHGESTPQIAETLGISEELVRQHKSRGLRSLRQMVFFTAT